jgi:hypothetical protein
MRAFYRGYHAATGRRAGQVRRLHVMREDGKFPGHQALCGAAGWGHTNSPPVIIDPLPTTPPEGLEWCRSCVGHAADLVGALAGFARMIAGLDELNRQKTATEPETQEPETPEGADSPCSRCHSLSTLEDDDRLDHTVFADQPTSSFTTAGAK